VPKRPSVELPRYVHRVLSRGREYFYFQRGRESASQEPSIRLPGNPHAVEFWAAYKEALGTEPPSGKTFDDLIAAYKFSPEFARLSDTSKREYTRYLETISELMSKFHVSALRPKHVIQLRDKFAATPVAANHLIAILRVLIAWGIPREFSDTNPCIHVPKLDTDVKGARPWPVWAYELINKHAKEGIRRAVLLAHYTGQRQEDVLRMAPEHIEDGGIVLKQLKTGKVLWMPGTPL
jgi:hypothetical protein